METQTINIGSAELSVVISTKGAELQSVKLNGKERLWQGDEKFWGGRSPVLFPLCGSLKDKKYVYEGKIYSMPSHGFARNSVFSGEKIAENKAVFTLKSSEETKKFYPFDFTFEVAYEVVGNALKVSFKVTNDGDKPLWTSVGSHESFMLDEPVEMYDLLFEKDEKFLSDVVVKGGLIIDEQDDFGAGKILPCSDDMFFHDTVVLRGINSRAVSLRHNGKAIATCRFDAENLLIWKVAGANYVCIEPWLNYPDRTDSDGDILKKPGLVFVGKGESFENVHSVEYFAE